MEKKVLLFSGGFDSMLQEWLIKPDILLYVDMRTSYSDREVEALLRLPDHYTHKMRVIHFPLGEYERDMCTSVSMKQMMHRTKTIRSSEDLRRCFAT